MKSEILGNKLRIIRKENKKSLQDIANKLSVSPQAVSQYELNKRDIPNLLLVYMFQSLGVSLIDLVDIIREIEDIPDDEKRNFYDFLHEIDSNSFIKPDFKRGSSTDPTIIPPHSTKFIYDSTFIENDLNVSYEIVLFHEENPKILENKDGIFRIDVKIEHLEVVKDFTFNLKYQPSTDTRVHLITVFMEKLFSEGSDPLDNSNHYDIYARSISSNFYNNLKISIKKAIDDYFKFLLIRPSTIDLYQDF